MSLKLCLAIAAITVLLSSCYKQSIADAMLNNESKSRITATLSYEINGTPVKVSVKDAFNQPPGRRKLYCEKAGSYIMSALVGSSDFIFIFYTDSLTVGNYKHNGMMGDMYVTSFGGKPQYIAAPSDHMSFTVTSYKDGHISGNFSGQLSPAERFLGSTPVFGASGSVVIRNGSFKNVPVFY